MCKRSFFRKYRLELAVLCGLLLCAAAIVSPLQAQSELAGKLTRLHIVANSDSDEDQRIKLAVRDRVLAVAADLKSAGDDRALSLIEQAACAELLAQGSDCTVVVSRTRMYFDTRDYDGFSLPAGKYDAVRVVIGEGKGKNWWCVLFPPLCAAVAEDELDAVALQAGLTDADIALITKDGESCVVRFKTIEWLSGLLSKLEK